MKSELRRYIGHRVVVQVGEDSIGGIVRRVARDSVTLDSAALITGQDPVQMDGEVIIPVFDVRWVQAI